MNKDLCYEKIREKRESFFVEYQLPIANNPFVTLHLIFPNAVLSARACELMDGEVRHWMGRYRVPLMVWMLDDKEDTIHPPESYGQKLVTG